MVVSLGTARVCEEDALEIASDVDESPQFVMVHLTEAPPLVTSRGAPAGGHPEML